MALHQLVYLSQATRKISAGDLTSILASAKKNNGNIDVTGSLFYNGGWFLQVLEGEKQAIDALYKKIEKDDRHQKSRVIYFEPASSRTFSRWTMNMVNLDEEQDDKYYELVRVINLAKTDRSVGDSSPAKALLKLFAA